MIDEIIKYIGIFAPLAIVVYLAIKELRSGTRERGQEVRENDEKLIEQLREKIEADEKRHVERMATADQHQKELVASYEARFAKLTTEMQNMEKGLIAKIAKLEGENAAKDKQLEIVNKILANRSPELEELLIKLTALLERVDAKMDIQTGMLQSTATKDQAIADKLITHNEETEARNKSIDKATATESGKVLRK